MLRNMIWLATLVVLALTAYGIYSNYAAGLYYLAGQYDRMMNPYGVDPDAPEPDDQDIAFHESMFVADMHADTLKWERDLLDRSVFGHTDVPRMDEGNVALQGFTIVTKSPMRMPWAECVSGNSPDTNTLLSLMQGRPIFNLRDRAFYQIDRYKDAVVRSRDPDSPDYNGTELRLIENFEDLHGFVNDRVTGRPVIGGFLGVEGAHWIGGGVKTDEDVQAEVRELYDAGLRMFAPNHRFDNALSGSNEGCEAYGLTAHGRAALREAERLGMVIDLAHISEAGLREAASILEEPFTISHTGIRENCEEPCRPNRNISDREIELILENDGVISVGFWPQAIGPSVWRIADVMEHIMYIGYEMGIEDPSRHIALGSDYDGSVTPLIEVGRLSVLTTILRRGPYPFTPDQIRNIGGRNACRLLATRLPGGDRDRAEALCASLDHGAAPELQAGRSGGDGPHGPASGGGLVDNAAGSGGEGGSSLGSALRQSVSQASIGGVLTDLVSGVVRAQSEMNHWLRGYLAGASSAGMPGALAIIVIGFVYGLLHAAGPGHGKVVVGAYFLAHPGRHRRAILLSFAIAFLQAMTAIAVVTALVLVVGATIQRTLDQAGAIEALAYGLVVLLGLTMLIRCFARGGTKGHCASCREDDRDHQHGEFKTNAAGRSDATTKDLLAMGLAVGLRPCSGALALLLFTLMADLYPVGVVATLAMGLGAAITISLSAVVAICIRRSVTGLVARAGNGVAILRYGPMASLMVQVLGALTIVAIGGLFLIASILRMGVL